MVYKQRLCFLQTLGTELEVNYQSKGVTINHLYGDRERVKLSDITKGEASGWSGNWLRTNRSVLKMNWF